MLCTLEFKRIREGPWWGGRLVDRALREVGAPRKPALAWGNGFIRSGRTGAWVASNEGENGGQGE